MTGTDVLTTVSHEVRTPLNAVLGMTQLLRQMALPAHASSLVDTIHASSTHMLTLVNDLLDASGVEAGQLRLDPGDIALRDLIEETVEIAAATCVGRPLSVVAVLDAAMPTMVRVDARRLRQVLTNLLANAIKFTAAGAVRLRVTRLPAAASAIACRVEVEDTGIGIAPESLARLCEPFVQADVTIASRYGGSGLGLSIASRILGALGATLSVSSTPGAGSRFSFDLHLERALDPPVAAPVRGQAVMAVAATSDAALIESLQAQATTLGIRLAVADTVAALAGVEGDDHAPVLVDMRHADARTLVEVATLMGRRVVQVLQAHPVMTDTAVWLRTPIRLAALASVLRGVVPGPTMGLPDAPAIADVPRDAARVLVVEDEDANQLLMLHVLQAERLHVDIVGSGYDACEAVRATQYDFIFMDCILPGMNGADTVRALRTLPLGEQVPIVGLTGGVPAAVRHDCFSAGMSEILYKPVLPSTLVATLRRWVPSIRPAAVDIER